MTTSTTCCDGPCDCREGSATRLRYTYGQRLTAVDLADEQAYHRGKHRFVNRYVLGYGVLCGLRATRGDGPPDLTPTLRVSKGAALDPCGNAIVVPGDQCLDVAAWFAVHRDELGWDQPGAFPAWIGLRYRECPADPVTTPREPCGCGGEGCAYSRVHESFELALHPVGGAVEPAPPPIGACAPGGGTRSESPRHCPPCDCDAWLLLAAVDVHVDEPGAGARLQAVDVSPADHDDPGRVELFTLQTVQDLAERAAAALGVCADGPRIGAVGGGGELDENGELERGFVEVVIDLAADADGAPVPLATGTIAPVPLQLAGVDAGGWHDVDVDGGYDAASHTMRLEADDLELDRPYRLSIAAGGTGPPVDEQLRAIQPSPWSTVVTFIDTDDGVAVRTAP